MYKQGNYQYNDDGTVSQLVESNTTLAASNVIQPIDIQSHYQQAIQTHNAISINAGAISGGSWISTDGFDKISVNTKADVSTSYTLNIDWSFDNSNQTGSTSLASGTGVTKAAITDVMAPFFRVTIINNDAAAHTFSGWALLKA